MQVISADKILSILRMKGPSIPVQIRKALGEGDTFVIGAVLTELRERKLIKVSNMKRGGSPYYYCPEHAHRLAEHLDDLGEKDRRTAQLLKEQAILKDAELDPLVRVSLRQLKDFAVPVEVKIKEENHLFWKWYTTGNDKAEQLIRERMGMTKAPVARVEAAAESGQKEERREVVHEQAEVVHEAKPREEQETKQTLTKPVKDERQESLGISASRVDDEGDKLLAQILSYFAEKRIQVKSKNVIRKHSEIDLEISMPTAVGRVDYYCKAKAKKKSNDGDLYSAYVQGQLRKIPVLYLTTGVVTKKAKEKINTELKGMIIVELEG